MSYNINDNLAKEIFDSIPPAHSQREAANNYKQARHDEAMNLVKEINYQIRKKVKQGVCCTSVSINPKLLTAWSPHEIGHHMKNILTDLGYKVYFACDDPFDLIIEW